METIRLGVIGTNFVSDWLLDTMKDCTDIAPAAVYSRTQEKGEEFASRHGIPAVYTDMDRFLASDIDAVYIASPNFLHCEQTVRALRAGKHVLIEKPAGLSLRQWEEMCAAADENHAVLMEAMRPTHDPAYDAVRRAIPELGALRTVRFEFCQYSSRYDKFRAGEVLNAFNPALGNAALMDIGCYAVQACTMLFGLPKGIVANSVILHNGMEGMGDVLLDYGDFHADILYSKISESVFPSVITGEDGTVTISKISTGGKVQLIRRGKEPETIFEPEAPNNMIFEIRDFCAAIRGEISDGIFREYTTRMLTVMDEIRRQNNIVFPTENN